VARVWRAQPQQVEQSVRRRLERLPVTAVALARALSVLGPEGGLRYASALAEIAEDVAAEAADTLVGASLVDASRPLQFTHPLLRTAVYSSVLPATRAVRHRHAAELLAADGVGAEEVAAHLLRTEPSANPWVVQVLRDAATRALETGAAESAARYLARALAEPAPPDVRAEVLHELGSAEARTGLETGIDHLREALAAADVPQVYGSVARELALALNNTGRTAEALELLDQAIAVVEEEDRELALLLEGDLLGYAQFGESAFGPLRERLSGKQQWRRAATPGERVLLVHRAVAHGQAGGHVIESARMAEEALGGGRLLAEQTADSATFYTGVHMLLDAERFDLVDPALDQALEDARRRGSVLGFAIASTQRSGAAYLRGAVGEAEMEIRAALDAVHQSGWELGLPMTLSGLLDVLIERGRLKEATDVLDRAGMAAELPELLGFDWLLYSRGRLRLADGDLERGLADLLQVGEHHVRSGLPPVRHNWRAVTAPALAARGERERAVAMAEDAVRDDVGTDRPLATTGMAVFGAHP